MRCELLVEINGYNSEFGVITSLTETTGGGGYAIGDILRLNGGDNTATVVVDNITFGTGLTINILSVGSFGDIITSSIATAGSGYSVNDTFVINGGGSNANAVVTSIGSGGSVTGYSIIFSGTGYTAFTTRTTTYLTGSISEFSITNPGNFYYIGSATTTALSGVGSGAIFNITDVAGSNSQYMDTYDDESVSLNFVISDINDISSKNSSYSKTITLPDTKVNRSVFQNIFDLNSDSNFDPTKKSKCWILRDTLIVFEGYIQLTSIIYDPLNFKNQYEVLIFADNDTLFKSIGESYLTDLDLSPYNHLYSTASIINSWSKDYSNGYYYPLIDYGFPLEYPVLSGQYVFAGSTAAGDQLQVTNFLPATYLKVITDQIFISAGFSYVSDFFNSDFYKQLVIPFNNKTLTPYYPDLIVDSSNNTFIAHPSATVSTYGFLGSITNYKWGNFNANIADYNPNNFYNTATHSYNNNYPSSIITRFKIDYDIVFNAGGASLGSPWVGGGDNVQLIVKTNLNPSGVAVSGWSDTPGNPEIFPYSGGGLPNLYFSGAEQFIIADATGFVASGCSFSQITASYPGWWRLKGTVYTDDIVLQPYQEVRFFFGRFNYDNIYTPVTYVTSNTYISAQVITNYLVPGVSYVDMAGSLPANVKQKDLLSSVIKMFNLYIEPDKNVNNGFIIEPRDDYYSKYEVIKDWSSKLDTNYTLTSQITSDTQNRTNLFTYKADKDIYNNSYTVNTNKVYGEYKYEIDNDFISDEKKIEIAFSPTIIDLCYGSSQIYLPIIANMNNGNYSRPEGMTMRLLYKKILNTTSDTIYFSGSTYSYYPYAGPFDNPLTPSLSLNFGQVTSFYNGFNDTTNNLFYNYWQNQMTELSDKNSRTITAYFYLTPYDISQFRFSDLIYFKYSNSGAYYRINKIYDYDPVHSYSTKIELIKATNYNIPLGSYIPESNPPLTIDTSYNSLISNINLSTSNVINSSSGIIISGRNNEVSSNSSNAVVVGRNNDLTKTTNSFVLGLDNSLNGQNCFIFGNNNNIGLSSSNIIIIGNNYNITSATNSFYINYKTFGLPIRMLYQDLNTSSSGASYSYSYTLNSGILKNDGDKVIITIYGKAEDATTLVGLFKINSTNFYSNTVTAGGGSTPINDHTYTITLIRKTNTSILTKVFLSTAAFAQDDNSTTATSAALDSSNNTFSFVVTPGGGGSTNFRKYFEVKYERATFDNSGIYW